jgi:hypothetical protein
VNVCVSVCVCVCGKSFSLLLPSLLIIYFAKFLERIIWPVFHLNNTETLPIFSEYFGPLSKLSESFQPWRLRKYRDFAQIFRIFWSQVVQVPRHHFHTKKEQSKIENENLQIDLTHAHTHTCGTCSSLLLRVGETGQLKMSEVSFCVFFFGFHPGWLRFRLVLFVPWL